MISVSPNWTDQVDFRPAPYQPDPLRKVMRNSLIAGGITLALGLFVIGGKLATLPDIDPMADPSIVVDYAEQPPADRGLLMVAPDMPADAVYALASSAPVVQARRTSAQVNWAEVEIPPLPEMPVYTVSDIAAPEVIEVAEAPAQVPATGESGPRPYYSLAAGDGPVPVELEPGTSDRAQ